MGPVLGETERDKKNDTNLKRASDGGFDLQR
jgi:hypothetical protein